MRQGAKQKNGSGVYTKVEYGKSIVVNDTRAISEIFGGTAGRSAERRNRGGEFVRAIQSG